MEAVTEESLGEQRDHSLKKFDGARMEPRNNFIVQQSDARPLGQVPPF
jgi:hypothetical protein